MVNNAGWTHRNRPALEVSEDEFDRVLRGQREEHLPRRRIHAVPALRASGGGCFINIASTAGVRPRPGLTWYNGSKGAVITTSKSLAAELGPDNIRVNCINPVFNPDTGLAAEFAGGPLTEERMRQVPRHDSAGALLDSAATSPTPRCTWPATASRRPSSGVCIEVDGARCV